MDHDRGDDQAQWRKAIGERIHRARIASGHENAARFARACGVQPNSVYRWEMGQVAPDIFSLYSIARVTRTTTDWLLGGEATYGSPVLAEWRATRRGQGASSAAMRFLEGLNLEGYRPTPEFYDLALIAFEHGLDGRDAFLGARVTESKKA